MRRMVSLRFYFSRLFILVGFTVCYVGAAWAQSALDGFDPNANDVIHVVVVQPDGKILIGGDFTIVKGISRNRIARLNPDGSLDNAFDPDANASVRSIAVQADGKILVGGFFSGAGGIGGQTRNYIARLDATTGLADPSFNPTADNIVLSIAVQADGAVLAGGAFTSIGGQTRNCIARLNAANGQADSFDPNSNSTVLAIAVVGGKILVGGAFNGSNSIGGQTRNFIARFDVATGGVDAWDPNANFSVRSFAVQADGKILVGGDFSGANSIGGQTRNRIARLDAITGLADSFNPDASAQVFAITVQPDGKVLVGGSFNFIGGQSRPSIARLNTSGALDNANIPDPNGQVFAIALQMDGKIVAGGNFTIVTVNGVGPVARNNIARLETDGRLDRTLDLGIVGNYVLATAVQPDGKILIGGRFTTVLGIIRNNIARLNADGTLDMAFNPNANEDVYAIAVQTDGKILVGGDFTTIGGQTRTYIARLNPDGTADSFNPTADSFVGSIVVQTNGRILVGGGFTSIGGQPRNRIARLDPTSGAVDSFDPNVNSGYVSSITVQADDKILVGGAFNTINGQFRFSMARLNPNGTSDSFAPNPDGPVNSIVVQEDGKILVGGRFTQISGQPRYRMARLDHVTGAADPFDPHMNNLNDQVYSIAVQVDGKILAGGAFTTLTPNSGATVTRNRIVRLNPDGTVDSFNPDANDIVRSIAVQPDGKILAGGYFNSIGGQTRNFFARLTNDSPAQQNLSATQTTVTWTRGGSSPQFSRVIFESSTDNVNYTPLGNGTATGSNWTMTGLSLPTAQNIYIRARGYYRSGIYNGSESITESVRNAFLSPQPMISGTVTYGNAAAPPKYISNVTVTGTGSPNVFTTTAAPGGTAGQYTLTGFGAGSYTVSLSKTTGQNSITSNDAARIAQHVSGSNLLNTTQKVVADVSNNGVVSSFDAGQIATFVATGSSPGIAGQWRFFVPPGPTFPVGSSPTSRTYSSVTSNITGDDYVGLLIGEVTGNWTPSAARPAGRVESGKWKVESEDGGPVKGIAVELPNMVTEANKEVLIPITIQGAADKEIISYEFNLRYDPSAIQPVGDVVLVKDSVSRGLSYVVNAEKPGILRVVFYGPLPISNDGVLLNLRFTAVGAVGSVSPISFERIMFNEGEPRVAVADGKIELF